MGLTRRNAIAFGSGLAGTVLAACSGQSAGSGGGAAPSAGCTTRIEVWGYGIGGDTMVQLINDFSTKQARCTVVETDQSDDAQGTVQTKLITAIAGGSPPDVTGLSPSRFRTWSDAGLIADVDRFFRRDKLASSDFPPALWSSMSYGGKVRALPFRANPDFVLHWYKPLFQQVGLPEDKGPQTIADLDRMIPMLTRESGGKLQQVGMQPWDFYGTGSNTLNAWGRAFGGSFYDEQKDQITFNHPRVIRAVEWYVGWAQRIGADKVTALTAEATAGSASAPFFASRKWAMHPLTPSAMQQLIKADPNMVKPDQIGAGPMPFEAPGKLGEVTIGGWGIAAVTGSKLIDAAWEFIKYCGASIDGTTIIARTNGLPGWLKSPGLDEIARDPMQKPYIDGIRRAEFAQFGFYVPVGPSYAPLDEAIAGKRTARDALETMQREAAAMYDDYRTRFPKKG